MIFSTTRRRVPEHSEEELTRRIRHDMAERLRYYADHPQYIDARLRELDNEWDVDRTIEANAGLAGLVGFGLGAFVHRIFYLLPATVFGFLVQHALQGWSPPVPFFRNLGVRSQAEIETERHALLALAEGSGIHKHRNGTRRAKRRFERILSQLED